jgi:sec-independent protein translocase protein TatA
MIAVVGVLVVIFLWGPGKLPQMARAIGQAKSEYDKVAKGFADPLNSLTTLATTPQIPAAPGPSPAAPMVSPTAPVQTQQIKQDPIVIAAKSLGISTEGKTKEELVKEITDRTATSSTSATTTPNTPKT